VAGRSFDRAKASNVLVGNQPDRTPASKRADFYDTDGIPSMVITGLESVSLGSGDAD